LYVGAAGITVWNSSIVCQTNNIREKRVTTKYYPDMRQTCYRALYWPDLRFDKKEVRIDLRRILEINFCLAV
jgi:hypothetical protein